MLATVCGNNKRSGELELGVCNDNRGLDKSELREIQFEVSVALALDFALARAFSNLEDTIDDIHALGR